VGQPVKGIQNLYWDGPFWYPKCAYTHQTIPKEIPNHTFPYPQTHETKKKITKNIPKTKGVFLMKFVLFLPMAMHSLKFLKIYQIIPQNFQKNTKLYLLYLQTHRTKKNHKKNSKYKENFLDQICIISLNSYAFS